MKLILLSRIQSKKAFWSRCRLWCKLPATRALAQQTQWHPVYLWPVECLMEPLAIPSRKHMTCNYYCLKAALACSCGLVEPESLTMGHHICVWPNYPTWMGASTNHKTVYVQQHSTISGNKIYAVSPMQIQGPSGLPSGWLSLPPCLVPCFTALPHCIYMASGKILMTTWYGPSLLSNMLASVASGIQLHSRVALKDHGGRKSCQWQNFEQYIWLSLCVKEETSDLR